MSATEAHEVIRQVKKVIGDVDIPLCVSILDHEGLEMYSTRNCSAEDIESTGMLGIMAFDGLVNSLKRRSDKKVEMLIFRTEEGDEYFITPVSDNAFMAAVSQKGKIGSVIPFLDGLSRQIRYALSKLD
ncbi:MAG: hypothetical protein ACFFD4_01170 [Candidatus Odinarchaeota archaeon]